MSNDDAADAGTQMSAQGKRKIKVRGGHRAHSKKILGNIAKILSEYEPSKEIELMAHRNSLSEKCDTLKKLDEEILEEVEDDEAILEEIEECEKVQLQLKMKISEVDYFFEKVNLSKKKIDVNRATYASDVQVRKLKLPTLKIKEFSGDPKEYTSFKDAFDVAVEKVESISSVEKFTYLKSFLTGNAEAAIKGLALTNANYKEAWEVLNQRFGSKQIIVNSHMDALI